MSGGKFEYIQYQVEELADQIDRAIAFNEKVKTDPKSAEDQYGWLPEVLSEETILKFKQARDTLIRGAKMAHRVDWLLSGDDGESSFHKRWEEDLAKLK